MPKVAFEEAGKEIEVEEGANLRKVARENGIDVYEGLTRIVNCRGFGLCGSDRVTIKGSDAVSPKNFRERMKLGAKTKERLACQVKVMGDITVSTAPAIEYGQDFIHDVRFYAATGVFAILFLAGLVVMAMDLVGL